jgi:signal transduction histidine kinase
VMASSELLVAELKQEPLLSLAKNVNRGAANLNNRINELLDLARGEIGMLQIRSETVDIGKLLREAAQDMTPVAGGKNQSLTLELPDSLPLVKGDGGRLRQVVLNLLNNACKFTPEGGRITLRARRDGTNLIMEIQDTGRGITEEEQKRLFEPYHRLESDREHLSGLGLGLALSKALVGLHGGRIWVESKAGKGSTFSFSIPLETAGSRRKG